MTRIVHQDIDEFARRLRGADGCLVLTASGASRWWVESIDLVTVSMQQLQTGGSFTFAGRGTPGTLTFQVPLTDPGIVKINGHVLEPDCFVVLYDDRPFVWTGSNASRWGAVTVPLNHTLAASVALVNGRAPRHACRRTTKHLLDRIKRVIDRPLSMDGSAETNTNCRRAAESAITLALAKAVEESCPAERVQNIGRPQLSRSRVIARVLALMNANEGQPLFIGDLCRAAQVSERTLRNFFQEYFGVGPMRMLKVRQLHEIRAALLRMQPQAATVTQIATRFGMFDLSLLARNYKALFGESPSQTLSRVPGDSLERVSLGWLQYASRIFSDENPSSV